MVGQAVIRRCVLVLALILFGISPARAQLPTQPTSLIPLGFCQLTLSGATLLTACSGGIPDGAVVAMITVETQNVRWRDDGTAPTSSVGMLVLTGTTFTYQGNLGRIDFIPATGSPVLDISFYKYLVG
jgi:hypothetical protein